MKVTKTEKIWLIAVIVFYFLYNLPFFPKYNEAVPTLVHAALTVIPLWVIIYIGMARVYRIYRLKSDETMGTLEDDPRDEAEGVTKTVAEKADSAAAAVEAKAEEATDAAAEAVEAAKEEVTDNG